MNEIVIANVAIHRDSNGRYSLNDLHRAAGSREKDAPNRWTRTQEYAGLVEELTPELAFAPAESVRGGSAPGTYVAKELVYAYAMWISPAFHLKVIRAYDAIVAAAPADPLRALNDPVQLRALLLGYDEKVIALQSTVDEQAPKVAALDRFATETAGSYSLREAAKSLQIKPKKFVTWLVERRWIYRHPDGGRWLAFQPRLDSGMLEHKVVTGQRNDGTDWGTTQVRVTAKGLARIAELLEHNQGWVAA